MKFGKKEPQGAIALDDAGLGKGASEIARVWIDEGGEVVVLVAAYAMEDPRAFGHLMADTIRHGARAYAGTWEIDEQAALQTMIDGFVEEMRDRAANLTTIQQGSLD